MFHHQKLRLKDIISKIKNLPKEEDDNIRAKVSLRRPRDNQSKKEHKSINQLKKDNDIVILPADKGRSPVILNKTAYIDKRYDQINNGRTVKLKKDLTESIKRDAIKNLQQLK